MKAALSGCIETLSPPDGLLSKEQLEEAGLDKAARRRRIEAGILIFVLPGVFRLASVPESWTQFVRATSIWLRGRGALSPLTSASLQGLTEGEGLPIEVSSTMRSLKSPTSQIVVPRVGPLENRDLRWVKDMRVTNPLRTIFDLAGTLNPNEFEMVVDEARRRRLIAERPLRELLERLGSNGRVGTRRIRTILESGEMQSPVPGSPFERRFVQFLRRRSIPMAERQVSVNDDAGRFVARVDFAYPDLKVAIECDGRKHHFGRDDWEKDLQRRSRLAALGWLVIHISWDMLVNEPDELERLIRRALRQPGLL